MNLSEAFLAIVEELARDIKQVVVSYGFVQ